MKWMKKRKVKSFIINKFNKKEVRVRQIIAFSYGFFLLINLQQLKYEFALASV